MKKIKLIFALGNPSQKFKFSFHNLGWLFLDFLKKEFFLKEKWTQEKNFCYFKAQGIIFAKGKLFMNQSGQVLKAILKKFLIKEKEILVIQDDSDLFFGNFKIVFNGGSGGHKGIESIFEITNLKNFWHLKIGARPKNCQKKAQEFILKPLSLKQKKALKEIFKKILPLLKERLELNF